MGARYSDSDFLNAIKQKCPLPQPCPFCNSNGFVAIDKMAKLQVQTDTNGIYIGESIPCGVLICKNCGHVNLFALGALGLLPKNDGDDNA